eukprot:7421258-Alexandrium_andersonii.AAC.1
MDIHIRLQAPSAEETTDGQAEFTERQEFPANAAALAAAGFPRADAVNVRMGEAAPLRPAFLLFGQKALGAR